MVFRLNGWITSACARRCRFLSLSFIANFPSSFILVATRVQTKIKKKRKVMKKRQNCEEDFERTKQKKIYLPAISSLSSLLNTNRMFETFSFLPPLSDADLTKQVQYLLNNGWTPCLELRTRPTPTLTATAGLVWTPPSTPTTTTTDTGSCGSCRCTVATTPTKSSKKSRRASRRSRTATSDAPASTTSSKCNVLASCATDRSWTRWKVVPDKSLTDKSKYA